MSENNLKMVLRRIILGVLIIMAPISDRASASELPPLPTDFSQIEIFLATRDIGAPVYSKYGHTIVRIVDHQNGSDIGYNWGTFDFTTPDFLPQFLKGILIYRMSFGPWSDEVEYTIEDRQSMWLEKVNLTTKQKENVVRHIYTLALPENMSYRYYFFYDNCSTRVRDLFDGALGGKIKIDTIGLMTGKSYRDRVIQHNASAPIFAMGQDVILNREPDTEMSEWDDMFIPLYLRDYLLRTPAVDDDGKQIPGQMLLSDTQQLANFAKQEIPAINGYAIFWILAGLPSLAAAFFIRYTSHTKLGIRLAGFSNIVLGAIWGLFGIFMALSWAFGSHTVLPHNANLWLMWPTDILYFVFGLAIFFRGQWLSPSGRFWKLLVLLTRAHLVCIVIFVTIFLGKLFHQDVSRVVLWFAPLTIIVFWPCIYAWKWMSPQESPIA